MRFCTKTFSELSSCFRAQPRRQRNESGSVADRFAFRLCIDAAHRDKLLDSSKWPDSVTVSEWYYIDPSRDRNQSNRGQQGRPVDGAQGLTTNPKHF